MTPEEQLEQSLLGRDKYALSCGCIIHLTCWLPGSNLCLPNRFYRKICVECAQVGLSSDRIAGRWQQARNGQLTRVSIELFQSCWDVAWDINPDRNRAKVAYVYVRTEEAEWSIYREGHVVRL